MKHGEKFFSIEENQAIWETYLNNIMDEWNEENRERLEQQTYTDKEKEENIKKLSGYSHKGKDSLTPYKYEFRRKKMSVLQYKPILLEFEEFVGKSFNDVTTQDMEKFIKVTTKTNKINHFNAFFRDCVSSEIIKNRDKNFLIGLLPEVYRSIGKMLAKPSDINNGVKDFFITPKGMIQCPFCGNFKDASEKHWLLIEKEGVMEKRLACKECEGLDGEYRY